MVYRVIRAAVHTGAFVATAFAYLQGIVFLAIGIALIYGFASLIF